MRLNFLLIISLIISFSIYSNEYVIKSSSGISHGYVKKNVIHWDDIPYAEPPTGDLRWKAPRKLNTSSREVVLEPKENNFCIQEPSGLGGTDGDNYFSGTEDCLYLDI